MLLFYVHPYFNGTIIHVANLVEMRHQFYMFFWLLENKSCFALFQWKLDWRQAGIVIPSSTLILVVYTDYTFMDNTFTF
jgi:hypothetical protein